MSSKTPKARLMSSTWAGAAATVRIPLRHEQAPRRQAGDEARASSTSVLASMLARTVS